VNRDVNLRLSNIGMKWFHRRRIQLLFCLLVGVISAFRLQGEPKWIRMQSPNFEVLSSAGEKETRNTLNYFEQVREFFLKFNGHAPKEPAPVTIVIFGSEKEYEPYSLNKLALAYFLPRGDRDYIVMGRTGELAEHVATHEYTHLIAEHAGLNYPPWLNEGLAELFSTFTIMNGSVAIGDPIPGRILALREDKWVPLATIMAADADSPYYNESGKAGSLYNEGWAAVHFIGTTKEYRPKFSEFLTAVANGTDSAEAIQTVYGKPLAVFETELRGYIGQGAYNHLLAKIDIDRTKKDVAAEAATPYDVKLVLTDIDGRPNALTERRRVLEELKKEDPKRPEPWAGLAYLDWQEGKPAQAFEGFSKAYALGAHSNRMLWDYGRLAQTAQPQESVKILKELASLEPNRVEVQIELAWSQYYARQLNDASMTLAKTKLETTQQAARYFAALGYVQLGMGDPTAATRTLDILKRYAKTKDDQVQVDRLTRALTNSKLVNAGPPRVAVAAEPSAVATEPATTATDLPPVMRRSPTPPSESTPSAPSTPSSPTVGAEAFRKFDAVSGTFSEFVCPANGITSFRIAVDTTEGKKLFTFKDPESISIIGKSGGKVDLYCGRQDAKPKVRVEYQKTDETGVDGVLRSISFEP
jgi:Tfp pilus assembly protein PilF